MRIQLQDLARLKQLAADALAGLEVIRAEKLEAENRYAKFQRKFEDAERLFQRALQDYASDRDCDSAAALTYGLKPTSD